MMTTMTKHQRDGTEEDEEGAAQGNGDDDEEPAFMRSQVLRLPF
jgi:hypothetical protein